MGEVGLREGEEEKEGVGWGEGSGVVGGGRVGEARKGWGEDRMW